MEDQIKSLELKYKFIQEQMADLQKTKTELLDEIIRLRLEKELKSCGK